MAKKINTNQLSIFLLMILMTVALWWTPVIYPFKLLVVFLHESCHALAAIITTGDLNSVSKLEVSTDESGIMQWYNTGGIFSIVASAGYIGTSLIGAFLLYFSTSKKSFSLIYLFLSFFLVFMTMRYVEFGSFSFFFGLCFSLIFFVLYIKPLPFSQYFTQFIAIMCCCYSVYDFADFSGGNIHQTDAGILANHWGIKILAYPIAIIWILLSLGMMFFAFFKSIHGKKSR